jgi:hypothetical protein
MPGLRDDSRFPRHAGSARLGLIQSSGGLLSELPGTGTAGCILESAGASGRHWWAACSHQPDRFDFPSGKPDVGQSRALDGPFWSNSLARGAVADRRALTGERAPPPRREAKNYSEAGREAELAIIDTSDPQSDTVVAIPERVLARKQEMRHQALPFTVRVNAYYQNSTVANREAGSKLPPRLPRVSVQSQRSKPSPTSRTQSCVTCRAWSWNSWRPRVHSAHGLPPYMPTLSNSLTAANLRARDATQAVLQTLHDAVARFPA